MCVGRVADLKRKLSKRRWYCTFSNWIVGRGTDERHIMWRRQRSRMAGGSIAGSVLLTVSQVSTQVWIHSQLSVGGYGTATQQPTLSRKWWRATNENVSALLGDRAWCNQRLPMSTSLERNRCQLCHTSTERLPNTYNAQTVDVSNRCSTQNIIVARCSSTSQKDNINTYTIK